MGDFDAASCGGRDLRTEQGLFYALTREDSDEVADCAFALAKAVDDPVIASALSHVPENVIGRFLEGTLHLRDGPYKRPAINLADPPIDMSRFDVQDAAFGSIGKVMSTQVLATVALPKARTGASATSLGGHIGVGDDAQRKEQALQFIDKVAQEIKSDGGLKRDFGQHLVPLPVAGYAQVMACIEHPSNCYQRGKRDYFSHADGPLQAVAAAFTSIASGNASRWGKQLDDASAIFQTAGLWPAVLGAGADFIGRQTNADARIEGIYRHTTLLNALLTAPYHAGNETTRSAVADATAKLQAHLQSQHAKGREGLGMRDGAPPKFHLPLMEYFLRHRDVPPPVAPADDLALLSHDLEQVRIVSRLPAGQPDARQHEDAAGALGALGQDASTLTKAMSELSPQSLKAMLDSLASRPRGEAAIEGLAQAVHDSHDPAACEKLANALANLNPDLGFLATSTVLYSMATRHQGQLIQF